jgi:ATP-dependent DNA helicase RecG
VSVEKVSLDEGDVLVVSIPPHPRGIPFHTGDGKYLIRLGSSLRGMSLADLDAIRKEAGVEISANVVPGNWRPMASPVAFEELRNLMKEAGAPDDLLSREDQELLVALGVLTPAGEYTVAGILLTGKPEAMRIHAPFAQWRFFHMTSDTAYDAADDGHDAIPIAVKKLRLLVAPYNPIVTIRGPLVHPEFPRYPLLALRELLINAFVHRDYGQPGATTLKLYPDRLELSNPGGFIGGVTPENILHHPSAPRYPLLFSALTRIRLANAANIGVRRAYRDLLREGKEPPAYVSFGHSVRVTIKGGEPREDFLKLAKEHDDLGVDDLLILHYLMRHREITVRAAAGICQLSQELGHERLTKLVACPKLLEIRKGDGGTYFRLSRHGNDLLMSSLQYSMDKRISMEDARARILAALKERPLRNRDVREITQLDRNRSLELMKSLMREGLVALEGKTRTSLWRRSQ